MWQVVHVINCKTHHITRTIMQWCWCAGRSCGCDTTLIELGWTLSLPRNGEDKIHMVLGLADWADNWHWSVKSGVVLRRESYILPGSAVVKRSCSADDCFQRVAGMSELVICVHVELADNIDVQVRWPPVQRHLCDSSTDITADQWLSDDSTGPRSAFDTQLC